MLNLVLTKQLAERFVRDCEQRRKNRIVSKCCFTVYNTFPFPESVVDCSKDAKQQQMWRVVA